MGLIKSGYPSLSMCRIAAHAAFGGNKPMPQWAFFEVRYSGLDPESPQPRGKDWGIPGQARDDKAEISCFHNVETAFSNL